MPSRIAFAASTLLTLTEGAQWAFQWPYDNDGSCRCSEVTFALETFPSKESCLQAFVDSEYELCSYQGRSISEKQCESAVSKTPGLHNSYCTGKCTEVVANLTSLVDYQKECDFEFVIDMDVEVGTIPDRCFSNLVFGWADYDASNTVQHKPLGVFPGVSSASRCQELCQDVPECRSFVWRARADHIPSNNFQNAPHTCILYDEEFMFHVLNDAITTETPTEFCNVPAVGECATITFPRTRVNPFEDQTCLTCGCEPRCVFHSGVHISGPAFCPEKVTDRCDFTRPSWTTTTPAPCDTEECVTQECPTEVCEYTEANTEEGTAMSDTALTSFLQSTLPVSSGSTTELQMTAESDTALTSSVEVTTGVTSASSGRTYVADSSNAGDNTSSPVGITSGVVPTTTSVGGQQSGTVTNVGTPQTRESAYTIVPPPVTFSTPGETTTVVELETSSFQETTTQVELETSSSGETTTELELESSTSESAVSSTTPGSEQNATTVMVSTTSKTQTKPDQGECVDYCESDCDDCYSISDCMDDEC